MSSSFCVCRGPVSSRYTGYFTVPQLYHRVAVDGPDSRDVTCGVLYRTLSRSYCICSRFFLSLSRFVTCVCRPSRTLRGNMIPRHKGYHYGECNQFRAMVVGKRKEKKKFFYSFLFFFYRGMLLLSRDRIFYCVYLERRLVRVCVSQSRLRFNGRSF